MTFSNPLRFTALFAALLVFAGTAAAQGPAVNASSTTSELEMTATVQTAVQLNISTGSGGTTVSGSNSTGLFSIAFGAVNGLGLGTPAAGVTVVADASGALYKSPINLTPVFSGFGNTEFANITVEAGASGDEDLAREGSSSISSSSTVTEQRMAIGGLQSGDSAERFVGFYIPRNEVAGAKTATLIYTVTVAME